MKKLSVLLIVVLLTCLTITGFASQGTKFASIELSDKQQLKIEYGNDIIYAQLMKKGDEHSFYLREKYFKIHGDTVVKNNLVKKGEYNLKIKYTGLTPDIATVSKNGRIDWKDEGLAKFKISAFDFTNNTELGNTTIEVKVIKLPLYSFMLLEGNYDYMSLEEVIEKFGFPDKERQAYFEWYKDSGTLEGIAYYFGTTNSYGAAITHWSYNKYPCLKLRVGGGAVNDVYTQGWDSGYDFILQIKF
jgi:hypothetical protein